MNSVVFSEQDISRAVTRIAHEILEKNKGNKNLSLVGIRTRGVTLAKRIKKYINDINDFGLSVKNVVITRYEGEASIKKFKRMLKNYNLNVYTNNEIPGYPNDLESVMKGYEKDIRVETDKKLTIVTGAGGNSGKMATCLSQVYNEIRNGVKTGYAKFETFPIWNLDIEHPINVAYEAATADLLDVNMIDPFHLKAYGEKVVNYNRDIENFDILIAIMKKITGEDEPFGYKSPTDMGVNMAAKGIIDDAVCSEAGKQEIISRYFKYKKYDKKDPLCSNNIPSDYGLCGFIVIHKIKSHRNNLLCKI